MEFEDRMATLLLSRRRLCDQCCLSVILSVSKQHYCKSNQLISLNHDVMIEPTSRQRTD